MTATIAAPNGRPSKRQPHRFTVDEYHALIVSGVLNEKSKIVLIRGQLVDTMSRNPPHDNTLHILNRLLNRILPVGWEPRLQMAVTLTSLDSEPEPDMAIVRGDETTYSKRHPNASDFGIVIEVADSSLLSDRTESLALYAEAGIPEYWIVNIPDCQIELHRHPQGSQYLERKCYPAGTTIPLVLDGATIREIAVNTILPSVQA